MNEMRPLTSLVDRRELAVLGAISGVAIIVALIYRDTFASMAVAWTYSSYRHGIVVFPLSLFLLWRIRGRLAGTRLRPWPLGIAPLAVVVAVWIVGRAVGILGLEHLAVVVMIPVAVAAVLGVAVTRQALFPLLFLLAAVPVGDALIPYLMRATADISSSLLRGVGVPVYREGQFITLPGGVFEVADVCAGLRYLIAGTTISVLFAYLTFRGAWRRFVFVVCAVSLLIGANGVRAFVTMWVASATEMRWLGGEDHIYFGWVLFALAMAGLFWAGSRYADATPSVLRRSDVQVGDGGTTSSSMALVFGLLMLALTVKPLADNSNAIWLLLLPVGAVAIAAWARAHGMRGRPAPGLADSHVARAVLPTVATAAAVFGVLIAGPAVRLAQATAVGDVTMLSLPVVPGCSSLEPAVEGWTPEFVAPDFRAVGVYRCADVEVRAYVAGYTHSMQGKELVNGGTRVFPEAQRRYATAGTASFAATDGRNVDVNEVRIDGAGLRTLTWYWYTVGDRSLTSPVAVKLWQTLSLFRGVRAAGTFCWLETPLSVQVSRDRARLASLAPFICKGHDGVEREGR